MKDSNEITLKSNFSNTHIQSAVTFSRMAFEIERKYKDSYTSAPVPQRIQYEACVLGAILCSVGYLEANINEFFSNINDYDYRKEKYIMKPKIRTLISRMWELGVPKTARYSVLEKYQIALTLCDKELTEKGKPPFQDIQLLIQLRNALTHYEPEWVTTLSDLPEKITVQTLEKKLKNKFVTNPFVLDIDPFFPDKCLSYDCAKWAISNSIEFTQEFYSKLELEFPLAWHLNNDIFDLRLPN